MSVESTLPFLTQKGRDKLRKQTPDPYTLSVLDRLDANHQAWCKARRENWKEN